MRAGLIGANDPPPFETINEDGEAALLLICDHASCAMPEALNLLGLDEATVTDHIGWDIGAAAVTRQLSILLDAPAVLAGYSRLLIDCNRPAAAPDLVPPVADGRPVPGNQDLSPGDIAARREAFFEPYHEEIRYFLDKLETTGQVPILAAIHSFTPAMTSDDEARPWQISICWDRDGRVALPALAALREEGLCVGENQPYGFDELSDFAIPEYGLKRGLPHILVEIRNDQIRSDADVATWAARLALHFTAALRRRNASRCSELSVRRVDAFDRHQSGRRKFGQVAGEGPRCLALVVQRFLASVGFDHHAATEIAQRFTRKLPDAIADQAAFRPFIALV